MSQKDYNRLVRAVAVFGLLFVLTLCALIGQNLYYNTKFEKIQEYITELRQYRQEAKDGLNGGDGRDGKDGASIVGPKGDTGTNGASVMGANGQTVVGPRGEPGAEGRRGERGATGRSIMCKTNLLEQTECKYVGDSEWVPESEFNNG